MAITAVFETPGMTQQQYEKTVSDLAANGLGAPDGRIHHVASLSGNGMFIVDIWESEELLGKFAEALMPIIIANGATPAEPSILPVHNIIEG